MSLGNSHNDFRTTTSLETLRQRAEIIKTIRQFFDQRQFLEVETPLLSHDTVVDRYLDPFEVQVAPNARPMYLQTSPEFGMKRLLACGAERIFQITRAFRQDEAGASHNPEFSMLEWYEVGADYEQGIQTLQDLIHALMPKQKSIRLSYGEVFRRHASIDPLAIDEHGLREVATKLAGNETVSFESYDRDNLLNWILARRVQHHLGIDAPTVVFDWPESQAALARTRREPDGVLVAERFELYLSGEEIANGYHELLDPNELGRRNQLNNELRIRDGKRALPDQSRLLEAMKFGLPACSGVALGIDRLVMKLLGLSDLSQVIAFPFDRA
jgi:elongation factor P--(R)-beta-lysine ligase